MAYDTMSRRVPKRRNGALHRFGVRPGARVPEQHGGVYYIMSGCVPTGILKYYTISGPLLRYAPQNGVV